MSFISSQEHEIIDSIQANISIFQVCQSTVLMQPEELAHKWAVGKTMAEDTVNATTHKFIRSALHPIDCRYRTRNVMLK